jgi:hypothetical protein
MALTAEQQALDFNPELQDVSRQRKLADLLMSQGMQQPQGQMISGHYVAPSFLQQLNPLANILAGQAVGERADTKQAQMAEMLRVKGDVAAKDVMDTYKTDPQAALAKASQYSQFPQVKALLPQLSKVALPEATTLEREFAVAKSDPNKPFEGSFNDFKNQMSKYQESQAADAKQRLVYEGQRVGLEGARFNFEKNKAEVNPAEAPLRTSFLNQAAPHIQISQAYRKIENAPDTAAGDMSKIFGFMKILDPGSTVREGEYASAENARGVPETVRAQYNKAQTGQRLTPAQRKEFTQAAGDLVKSQEQQFNEMAKYYSEISARSRINPESVIYNPYKDLNLQTTPAKTPKTFANQSIITPQAVATPAGQFDPKLLQFMTPEQQALFGVKK